MSKYIKDIDDQEFIEMVAEIESKNNFFDKLYYSIDKTGIQCLLPEDFVSRTVKGSDYLWGFDIENEFQSNHVLNIICAHHHNIIYDGLIKAFLEKIKSSDLILLPGIVEYELEW